MPHTPEQKSFLEDAKGEVKSPEEALARAVEIFGITEDPREAAFVLPDGRLLDFSGRSCPDRIDFLADGPPFVFEGRRNVCHWEIIAVYGETFQERLARTDAWGHATVEERRRYYGFCNETGAARIKALDYAVSICRPLARRQVEVIVEATVPWRAFHLDVVNPLTFRAVHSVSLWGKDGPHHPREVRRLLREASSACPDEWELDGSIDHQVPYPAYSLEGDVSE